MCYRISSVKGVWFLKKGVAFDILAMLAAGLKALGVKVLAGLLVQTEISVKDV